MVQFSANIFWYQLVLPTTYGPQKFSKSRVLKVNYFYLPREEITQNWNHGLIFMLVLFSINEIKNLRQFSEKQSPNMGFKSCILIYKMIFALNTTKISLSNSYLGEWEDEYTYIIDF